MRSIKSKVNDIFLGLTDLEFDVVCLSESWLDSSVDNNEFIPSNYQVYRIDRNFNRLGRQRGGGVLLILKNIFSVSRLDLSIFSSFFFVDIAGCKLRYGQIILHVY